ncbi:KRI1-like family C-terminal-domain-containing protein [Russula dissimulans]|nr:KRI1-like family C-terminal-domain-containing protein [Russula dissimulans]
MILVGVLPTRAALDALDLDAEWDGAAHDRQMAAVLAETDRVDFDGDEKPTWDDDIDVGDIVPPSEEEQLRVSAAKERKKAKKKEKRKRAREDDVGADVVDVDEMDADAIEEGEDRWDEVEWDGTEEMRKRVLDQYMDEVYELEFNDMVAGKPTHFRYIPVARTAYALTPAEILLADDKDLNEYVGLKKIAPYRKQRETWDAKRTERLREFKKKVSERAKEAGVDDVNAAEHVVDGARKAKKRKGRKERMREKAARDPSEVAEVTIDNDMKSPDSARGDIYAKQSRNDGGWVDTSSTSEPVKKKRRQQKRAENPIGQAEA